MATVDDAERALPRWTTPTPLEPTAPVNWEAPSNTRLPARQFVTVLVTIGGMQLMAAMDGPVAVFALPKIQNDLGLSDAGGSWGITASALTFGGLILVGGRLGD